MPPAGVPQNALDTLNHIERTGAAPQGFKGGIRFDNRERLLPATDARGKPTSYREWDVNPYVPAITGGPQRLLTGSDGSAYYTGDHYKTFIKIK